MNTTLRNLGRPDDVGPAMAFRTRSTRLLAVAGITGAALTASAPTTASAAVNRTAESWRETNHF